MHYNIDNPDDVRDLDDVMPQWIASENPKAQQWIPLPPKPSDDATWQNGQWVEPTQEELYAKQRATQRADLGQQWEALPSYIRGPYRDKFEAANRLLDEGDDTSAIDLIDYATPMPDFTAEQITVFNSTKASMKAGIEALP